MPLILTFLIFVVIMLAITMAGMKLWVKPKEAMDRVSGVLVEQREHIPSHPSLVFREILEKLGKVIPENPKDVNAMQRRLIRAGFRGPNGLKLLYGSKVAFAILLPILMTIAVTNAQTDPANKLLAVLGSVAAGFFGPNEYV